MIRASARRALLGAYTVAMLAVLLLPVPAPPPEAPADLDKMAHLGLSFGLAVLAAWSARGGRLRRTIAAVGWATALGVLTEGLQAALPYRTGDPLDLAADLLGGLAGAALGSLTSPPSGQSGRPPTG